MPKGGTCQFSSRYLLTDVFLVRKYTLSLDGGGFRALSSLIILNHIMRMLVDDPDEEPIPSPCQVFDLICGTSTGGIIAILLGRLGLDCSTAITIYKELGPRVFGRDEGKMWTHILAGEQFSSTAFETFLGEVAEKYTGSQTTTMKTRRSSPDAVEHRTTDVSNVTLRIVDRWARTDRAAYRYSSRPFLQTLALPVLRPTASDRMQHLVGG